ncbi:MAG: hypothetical protein AVDCRST_MAG93-8888, partial [uncultured Chloroflexia bacterium]
DSAEPLFAGLVAAPHPRRGHARPASSRQPLGSRGHRQSCAGIYLTV